MSTPKFTSNSSRSLNHSIWSCSQSTLLLGFVKEVHVLQKIKIKRYVKKSEAFMYALRHYEWDKNRKLPWFLTDCKMSGYNIFNFLCSTIFTRWLHVETFGSAFAIWIINHTVVYTSIHLLCITRVNAVIKVRHYALNSLPSPKFTWICLFSYIIMIL